MAEQKDERRRIEQARGQANRRQVKIEVENGQRFVLRFGVQIQQLHVSVLARERRITERFKTLHRFAGGGFGNDHRSFESFAEIIENSAQSIGVRAGELISCADIIRFYKNIFFLFQFGRDGRVDGAQGIVGVLPAVLSFHERNERAAIVGHDSRWQRGGRFGHHSSRCGRERKHAGGSLHQVPPRQPVGHTSLLTDDPIIQ